MRILVWLVRAALFFVLFAFALNNQQESAIHWFFGYEWRTRVVYIVLGAFALGCAFGIFAMVPSWWRHRRIARREGARAAAPPAPPPVTVSGVESGLPHPPRDGL